VMNKTSRLLGILLCLLSTSSLAARSSTGSYTAPVGANYPYQSGNVISSTQINALIADFIAEITNSLDRQGRGAMLAQLQCSAGSVATPGLAVGETGTGLYRPSVGDLWVTSSGINSTHFSSTHMSTFRGLTVTTTTTNESGTVSTGNGSGWGGQFVGGATGSGVSGTGVGGGNGGVFTGATSGHGVTATGGTSGDGVRGTPGGANNFGGHFYSYSSSDETAIRSEGQIHLYGGRAISDPAFVESNSITATNTINVYGCFTTNGTAAPAINVDHNVASVVVTSNDIVITPYHNWAGTETNRPFVSGPVVVDSQATLWQGAVATGTGGAITVSAYGAGGSLTTKHNLAAAGPTGTTVCVAMVRGQNY
jgi:hypothetical protein